MVDVKMELNPPPIKLPSMVPPSPVAMSSGSLSPSPDALDSSPETHHAQHHYQQSKNNRNLRAPKCTRCRNHGVISDLRGHKHKCYWRDCTCTKCLISSDRQRATADRIALFRQQVRQITTTDQRKRNEKRKYSESRKDDDQTVEKYSQISRKSLYSIYWGEVGNYIANTTAVNSRFCEPHQKKFLDCICSRENVQFYNRADRLLFRFSNITLL